MVKCPVYSGTPLLWTPWGHGEVSCIQWNPSSNVDTFGDMVKCPIIERCPHFRGKFTFVYEESIFGTYQSVLNTEVSIYMYQGCPLRRVPLYFLDTHKVNQSHLSSSSRHLLHFGRRVDVD